MTDYETPTVHCRIHQEKISVLKNDEKFSFKTCLVSIENCGTSTPMLFLQRGNVTTLIWECFLNAMPEKQLRFREKSIALTSFASTIEAAYYDQKRSKIKSDNINRMITDDFHLVTISKWDLWNKIIINNW